MPPKSVPEPPDFYSLNYVYKSGNPEFRQRANLAQIIYETTGCLLPRDLHRYDPVLRELRRYGITGKKQQSQLLSCMLLLGESRHRGNELLYISEPEALMEITPEPDASGPESDTERELREQLAALQLENKRLRTAAYEAGRELQQAQKNSDAQRRERQMDRQELADLRSIVFSRQHGAEEELPLNAPQIQLPYNVAQRTVIFGGHDTWRKAIKPMLSGDIRFVDREMQPDLDLIRHADVIWIQPNSISHSFYYTVIDAVRRHKIPVRYFTFASAEKCARQLAVNDQNRQ